MSEKNKNLYESVFIARQDLSATQVESLADSLEEVIKSHHGKILKRESWGYRTLAYKIKKNRKGHYIMLNFEALTDVVKEYERVMRLNEDVIRFLTMRIEKVSEGPSPMLQARSYRDFGDDADEGGTVVAALDAVATSTDELV